MITDSILGIKFNPLDQEEFVARIAFQLEEQTGKDCRLVVTPNAEIVMQAARDKKLREIINRAWLSTPDGAGIILASKLLPELKTFPARVAGFDLLQDLLQLAAARDYAVYFLGGEPGVAAAAAENLKKKHPGLKVAGCHHGYLDRESSETVLAEISSTEPELLFVGMGAPRQEKFLAENQSRLAAGVAVTVGGSFDILAGKKPRAPEIIQKLYLEWFYRLLQEPGRISRISILPLYLLKILLEAGGQHLEKLKKVN